MKKIKIWLIRENKNSNQYYITTDQEWVRDFIKHRRHYGRLVWCRCFIETGKYSIWTYLWLIKTYMVIERSRSHGFLMFSGEDPIDTKLTEIHRDVFSFDSRHGSPDFIKEVIKIFRTPLKRIEKTVWSYRNLLKNDNSLDYIYLRDLLMPKGYKPSKYPDLWSDFDIYAFEDEYDKLVEKDLKKSISWNIFSFFTKIFR